MTGWRRWLPQDQTDWLLIAIVVLSTIVLCAAITPAALTLVELHGPEGQRYYLNPVEISTIREPVGNDLRHFSKGTRCLIVTTNGKFLAVHETCDEVRAEVNKAP